MWVHWCWCLVIFLFLSNNNNNLNIDDEIGEIFQDENNMAAILMRNHAKSSDLLMVR